MARDRTPRDAFGRPLAPDASAASGTVPRATPSDGPEPQWGEERDQQWEEDRPPQRAERRDQQWEEDRPPQREGEPGGAWGHRQPAAGVSTANPQATVALVLGVLGLVVVPVLLSIAAVIVARRADRVADGLPGAPGRGAARAARLLGYAGFGLWIVVPAVTILLFILAASSGSG